MILGPKSTPLTKIGRKRHHFSPDRRKSDHSPRLDGDAKFVYVISLYEKKTSQIGKGGGWPTQLGRGCQIGWSLLKI